MKNATVMIPFTGSVFVYLENLPDETTEDDCFDLALDALPQGEQWGRQLNEIEFHKQMNRGNICYATNPEMEQLDDADSERQPSEFEVNECDDLCWEIT
jgi:hypothetical protein